MGQPAMLVYPTRCERSVTVRFRWQPVSVPRRPGLAKPPCEWVSRQRGSWPLGPFTRDTPTVVKYAAAISELLDDVISEQQLSRTEAAQRMGLSRSALHDVLAGRTLPDLQTLVKLEAVFKVDCWPSPYPSLSSSPDRQRLDL